MSKYKKGSSAGEKVTIGLLGVAVVAVVLAAVFLLAGLLVLFGWNVGVVAAVTALGGSAGSITFWQAVGIGVALTLIRPTPPVHTNKKG